jgi:NTE family protein
MQRRAAPALDSPPPERSDPRLGYERIALVLQGGGALGAYQAGVYEGLYEAGIAPDWVVGISIGAINAALIAGNAPERRVARLREFWELVCEPALAVPLPGWERAVGHLGARGLARDWSSVAHAAQSLYQGRRGFFVPRMPPPWPGVQGDPGAASFYDASPLAATLGRLVEFGRVNGGDVRLAVGAVNVRTGNFVYFDSAEMPLGAAHVMASSALPPGFAAVEIDGEFYWDGGLVSNTPLEYALETDPRCDTLAFQVDLWSARGPVPRGLLDVLEREKDIRFSSRTRLGTDALAGRQRIRRAIAAALTRLPDPLRGDPALAPLNGVACTKVMNVVHLIYHGKAHEGHYKDYEFSRAAMEAHWRAGLEDMRRTLAQPGVLDRPPPELGVVTHDVHRTQHAAVGTEHVVAAARWGVLT